MVLAANSRPKKVPTGYNFPVTFALALDIGGTKADACLTTEDGQVVVGTRSRAETGPATTNASLDAAIYEVIRRAVSMLPARADLAGVGIGSAGPIDVVAGTISPLNMPKVDRFPVVDRVRSHLPVEYRSKPVALAHDGQCIAVAEHWLGAGRGAKSMLGMVVSTGIGGGIVLEGAPLRGASGNAGHIGQIEVASFAPQGVTGLEATVERIASGPNIVRWARERGWRGVSGEDLSRDYANAHEIAVAAVHRSAAAVGAALTSAAALLDFDLVVVGGGFSYVSDDYIDLVRRSRDTTAAFPFLARADITRARLGPDSPLVGASAMILRR